LPKVKILRLGARHNRKPLGAVGDVVEVTDAQAKALAVFGLAKPVNASEKADKDADPAPEPDENEDTPNPAAEADGSDESDDKPEHHEATAKDIREWAKSEGIDVPSRGAIPADVREKFNAAHAD
jgi:hypothetical protein